MAFHPRTFGSLASQGNLVSDGLPSSTLQSKPPFKWNVIRNMPKKKSPLEQAAGKLISAIQKQWGNDLGETTAEVSEEVMGKGHNLLQASTRNEVSKVLCGLTVTQYLGELWVRRHPSIKEYIENFERELRSSENV